MNQESEAAGFAELKKNLKAKKEKKLLKSLEIEGEYPEGAKRKDNWVYYVE